MGLLPRGVLGWLRELPAGAHVRPLAFLLVLLAGCTTQSLPDEWSPLSKLVERPSIPGVHADTVTTRGSSVYVEDLQEFDRLWPPGSVERKALLTHEREHARRQFRYEGLPGEVALNAWVARYLTDHEFMWQEEQVGWYWEIRILFKAGKWTQDDTKQIAHSMSHNYRTVMGKRMVSFAEAKAWIELVLQDRWRP